MGGIGDGEFRHGVLMLIDGVGVLIIGDAGAGKSDCALQLLSRGHRLVADDVVRIERAGDRISGHAPRRFSGVLEVRSLGFIDVQKVFGTDAYAESGEIDLVIELRSKVDPTSGRASIELLGAEVAVIPLDLAETQSPAVVIETAARAFRVPGSLISPEDLAERDPLGRSQ